MTIDYEAAAPVLKHAADLIDTHGWARGELRSQDDRLCAHGAISFAASGRVYYVEISTEQRRDLLAPPSASGALAALRVLRVFLERNPLPYDYDGRKGADDGHEVAGWNDYCAGSPESVTAAMRDAAQWAVDQAMRSA
jgi:hypothetical protein